jgi:RNA-directed DNA polymerase
MSGGMGREWRTGHDRAIEALQWGKLAAPARPRLTSLNHSFTLDLVICCRSQAGEALATMRNMMSKLKLTVNDTKTRVCKLPEEKFEFLAGC